MKKSLIITLGLVTLFFGQYCTAQLKTTDSAAIKFWDIKTVISKGFQEDHKLLDTTCINTVLLIKFKVINSRIDSIEFTKSTPQPFRQVIKNALHVDRGGLTLIDGKSYEKKTIIIPIHFAFVMNCKPALPIEIDSNGAIIEPVRKDHQTSLTIGISEILDFDSGNKASIECIWLSSMYLVAMY